MARAIVGNPFENQIPTVAPTASPVDTFIKPVVQKSPFETLSKTLNDLEQKASPIFEAERQRRAQNEIAEGERLYQENRIAIGDAVRDGIIEEGASPYVRRGYRISQMNTMSMRYTAELENALESRRLYTTGDPARIEAFISEFQQEFVNDNGMGEFADHEVAEFFGVKANQGNEIFREAWRDRHVAWQAAQAYAAFEREVAQATLGLFRPDQTPQERESAMSTFAAFIQERASDANIDGLNNARMIDTLLNGVALSVEATGDTAALDVFNQLVLGTGPASGSLRVQERILQIQNRADTVNDARSRDADSELDGAHEVMRTEADRAQLDFMQAPTPENRTAFEEAIAGLSGTTDEKSTGQAIDMQEMLTAYDLAQTRGGVNQTADTQIALQRQLSNATDETNARAIIRNFATLGAVKPTDVFPLMDRWRTEYDPNLGSDVGLQMLTASTIEGRHHADLYSFIIGNEFNDNQTLRRHAQDAQRQYRINLTEGVRLYTAENGRPPSAAKLDEIAYNIVNTLRDRYSEDGIMAAEEDAADN